MRSSETKTGRFLNLNSIRIVCFTILGLFFNHFSFGQLSEGFETGLPAAYTTNTTYTLSSGTWTGLASCVIQDATAASVHSGTKTCQLKSSTGSQITTPQLIDGVNVVSFWACSSGASGNLQVQTSTDGVNFTQSGTTASLTATVTQYTYIINSTAVKYIRFYRTAGTVRIDDVSISSFKAIVFNSNTGTGTAMTNQVAATGTVINLTLNSYTKLGHTFLGWNTIANGGGTAYNDGSSYTIGSSNVTLYAQWTPNNYTLTFDANTGTGSMSSQTISCAASANLTANSFTKTGYTFSGWNTAVNGSGTTYADQASYTMGTANATLYAQWTANNNTLTFDGNGSTSGNTASQIIASNASANLNTNGFLNTGYNFSGWSTTLNGTVDYTDGASYTMGTASATLYAVWTIASTPTISTTGALSVVNTTYGTASSSPASFSVSGSTLTNNITVTAPTGYEVSTGGAYTTTLDLVQTAGTVSATTVFVRLAATSAVGTYAGNVALTSTGASTVNVPTVSSAVNAAPLTISGISGVNKEYDGTSTATFSGSPAYNGLVNGETFSVQGTPSASFNTSSIGTNKPIIVSGFTSPSSNYTLTQPSLNADITAKTLTITGASAANKPYDGNTNATISGGSLVGVISPDVVTLNQAGSFVSANVGTGISVTPNFTLGGASAGNYTLTQPTGLSADITLASQTITFGALANQFVGNADYSPGATANSGLSVSYTSSNTSVATIVNGIIHIVAAGSTTITATQTGNNNYAAATSVSQSLTVINPPLAAWDFTGENTAATSTAEVYNANLDASSSLTRGAGAVASAGANSFRTQGFQNNGISTSSNDYFQTTLSAVDGYTLSISSINARFAGTTSFYATPGVTSQFAYSLDGTNFTLIGSPVQHTTLAPPAFDLSGISALQNVAPGTTVTFRYYASGQTATGGWGFSSSAAGVYGLSFNGSVTAIASALPVELLSLNAQCADDNIVVEWATATEHNTLNFAVQRSEEGTTWSDVQTVEAAGNSNSTIRYSIEDRNSAANSTYYRLIQTDQDGVQKIYGPILTNCGSENIPFMTYPNPSTGDFTLQFGSETIIGDAVMTVADGTGKILRSVQMTIEHGTQSMLIPSLNLTPGIYHIRLTGNQFQTIVFKHSLH